MKRRFWKNKNVLITGVEGFLGSNLAKRLLLSGARITGLDIRVGRDDTILSSNDYRRLKVVKGSVCNYKLVKGILDKRNIEIVFHLAAEAIVGKCLKRPVRAFSSNIRGTWSLLEACRHSSKVTGVVVASSDKAYGSHDDLPYMEDAPLNGKHPYDVSKSCADLIAHAYYNTYGTPVAVTRCGNIYGPGDYNFSRLVPDVLRCVLSGKTFSIRSDGKFTRDYVYVDDIVDGYILLAERLEELGLGGEAFNFSYEKPMSVMGLVERAYRLMDKKPAYRINNIARHEIKDQALSSAKARKILGWKPKHRPDDGLRATMEWYRSFLNRKRRRTE